jgi:hypothetical protein
LLADIEKAKALERMAEGGKGGIAQGTDGRPHLDNGESRDAIGKKLGMSGRQYDRTKYIAENAPPEMIEQLDKEELTINKAYNALRIKEKSEADAPQDSYTVEDVTTAQRLKAEKAETRRRWKEIESLPPEDRIAILKREVESLQNHASNLASDFATLNNLYKSSSSHKDSIIENQEKQLTAAREKIKELEAKLAASAL